MTSSKSCSLRAFGVFEFMLPEMGIEFGFTRMFVNERTAAINACRGGACSAYASANYLVPLAIVWWLVPRLFDGPVFASAAGGRDSGETARQPALDTHARE